MTTKLRIGLGFDVHRFGKSKKPLILAGIKIPSPFSLEAVSDGDVVLHAIADSICGAASLGDIGDFFPPNEKRCQNLASCDIVKFVLKKAGKIKVINLDVTVIAEKPRLAIHKNNMLESLKKIILCKDINIKIKSKEKLNILGGVNSIACIAAALVEKC